MNLLSTDWRSASIRRKEAYSEETIPVSVDFTEVASDRGTSVSSVEWASTGVTLAIADQALSSGVASANVSSESTGYAVLKIKATFADETVKVESISLKFINAKH